MTHLRLGTESILEPRNKWSSTMNFVSLFSHRAYETKVHLEELNLSQGEPNPEDAIASSGEAGEVRGEGFPRDWVCDIP